MRQKTLMVGIVAYYLFVIVSLHSNAQVVSQRTLESGVSDWFNAAAWDNGIPNNVGDTALLQLPPTTSNQLLLVNSVTLERLSIEGSGVNSLDGVGPFAGPLLFRNDGTGMPAIELIASGGSVDTTISVPVSLSSTHDIQVNTQADTTLHLTGEIISADGSIYKQGSGTLRLGGNNSAWDGNLVIEGGHVFVDHVNALGGLTGQTIVNSNGILELSHSSAETLDISGGEIRVRDIDLSGPISITNLATFYRPQNEFITDRGRTFQESIGPTALSGNIAGTGDLKIQNDSVDGFYINGNNSYSGHTYITAGYNFATTSTALGSSTEGTTVQGGYLIVQAPTNEQFRVEGGTLQFNGGDFVPNVPLTIAGGDVILPYRETHSTPVVVDSTGGRIRFGYGSASSWNGGSSGVGSLEITGPVSVDAPLTHNGDLIIDGVTLNAVNSYTGKTIIKDSYVIDRPDVFGTSSSLIEIDEAVVTVNVIPNGDRGFHVKRGTLDVQVADPINGQIILSGISNASIQGMGTFNGPIDYITTQSGGEASLWSGVFNGPIRGTVDLGLGAGDGIVVLNAANQIDGRVRIRGGTVVINHTDAINLPATQIESGVLELNVPANSIPLLTGYPNDDRDFGTLRLNVDQVIDDTWVINEGIVESAANVKLNRVLLLGVHGIAGVSTTAGGSLEISDELVAIKDGRISGKITGVGNIRNVGSNLRINGDLTGFTGGFHAEHGQLQFGTIAPTELNAEADIHVYKGASLSFGDFGMVVENDIFLHNAHGLSTSYGSLTSVGVRGDHTLAGRIDVGDTGSTITGNFVIEGTLTGANLTIRHNGVHVKSPQNQLQGVLRLDTSILQLADDGQFTGLDSIEIENGGGISIRVADAGLIDRVDDSIAIHSRGGSIDLFHHQHTTGSETLGTLHLDRGRTVVLARPTDPLFFTNLTRAPGSLLEFNLHAGTGGVGFITQPALENGMIGPWAVTGNGFATLKVDNTFETLAATSTDLGSAGPTDHVLVSGSQTLTGDKTILSLQIDPSGSPDDFNLGGHLLTVASGGVFQSPDITNGRITAGNGQPAELIFYNTQMITADIVDNGEHGAVSLVMARDNYSQYLRGNNSYTGGTWIHGDGSLYIEEFSAIPENDRVYIEGGRYNVSRLREGTVNLAELHLHGDGIVSGFNAPIDADAYYLEYGRVNAPFTGNGIIYKDSDQTVDFENVESPNFVGQVIVREGLLSLDYDSLPNAAFTVEGGRVKFSGNRGQSNSFILDGGILSTGKFFGDIMVQSDSTLYADSFTTLNGALSGDADLTIQGTLDSSYQSHYVGIFGDASQFSGDIMVESGALRLGAPGSAGSGDILVQAGARLIFGSNKDTSPPTEVDNTIHLHGGALISTPPQRDFQGVAPPGVATGDVYVHGEAFIGANRNGNVNGERVPGLSLDGRLFLTDNSQVYGLSDSRNNIFHNLFSGNAPLVDISGQLLVGENTAWNLLTSSVSITGSIHANAQQASINFVGIESSLNLSQASFEVEAGKTLCVMVNGNKTLLELEGPDAGISGNGIFSGDVKLTNDSAIAPGSSAGALTVQGNTTFGGGAIYEWEIATGIGAPGSDWDLLQVDGDLNFEASLENPWILQIIDLPGFTPLQSQPWLIATADNISGFDPSATQINIDELLDTWPSITASQFSLHVQGSNLLLQLVPEPSSLFLAILGLITLTPQRMHQLMKQPR